jgi:hypothetical protein
MPSKKYEIKIGEKYGKWIVLNNHVKHIKPSGAICYLNLCECGKESLRSSISMFKSTLKGCFNCCKKGREPWNKGKTISMEMKNIMKIKMKGKHNSPKTQFKKGMIPWNKGGKMPQITGEKNYLWISNRTKLKRYENSKERRSPAYAYWRKIVIERDCFECKINNKDCKGRLEVHHILGFKKFPELKYDINNGITLCRFHHPRKRKDEEKLSPYFQQLVAENKSFC